MKKQAVDRLRKDYSVRACCRALGISRSSYYESQERLQRREEQERPIVEDIKAVQKHRYKRYFRSPRMVGELRAGGPNIGRHQTARIMRKNDLPASKRRRFVHTTDSSHSQPVAPNHLNRSFKAGSEERVWCADITYLRTLCGFPASTQANEMLCGRTPFEAESIPQVMFKICFEEPAALGEVEPRLPATMILAIERAMAKDREQRFENASAFVSALESEDASPTWQAPTQTALRRPLSPPARLPLQAFECSVQCGHPGADRRGCCPSQLFARDLG